MLVTLWVLVLLLDIVALWGLTRLQYDDGLEQAFSSDTKLYSEYLQFQDQFEGGANDLIAVFLAADFAAPNALGVVSDFVLDVQFLDGIHGVISPLSLAYGPSKLLVPPAFPRQTDMAVRFENARATSPDLQRLLSPDRTLLVVALLQPTSKTNLEARQTLQSEIEALAQSVTAGQGMQVMLLCG